MWKILKKTERWFFKNWAILSAIYAISICVLTYILITDQQSNRVTVLIASGRETDDSYKAARILADHINSQNTYLQLRVIQTQGANRNLDLLLNGQADLALVHYDPKLVGQASSVAILFEDVVQIISRPNFKFTHFGDLVGKNVAFGTARSGEPQVFQLLEDHYNLASKSISTIETSWNSAVWGFKRGLIDAIFRVKFANNEELMDLISDTNSNIGGINQSQALEFKYPYFKRIEIPTGTYVGDPAIPAQNLESIAMERFIVASNKLDPEVVRDITEILFDEREYLLLRSTLFGFMKAPEINSLIPVHEGAEAYFNRENPSFLQRNAELLALSLTILAILGSVYVNIKNETKKRRVNTYNSRLLTLKLKVENAKDLVQLAQFKEELDGFIGRVVEDAVSAKISSEGFDFFAFTWENVKTSILEKEQQLK